MLYQRILRPILFGQAGGDAETIHEQVLSLLALASHMPAPLLGVARAWAQGDVQQPRTLFGVRFPGILGLAAGMDKDGVALDTWSALGFSFVEVGTVTRYAQPGNPRPRLFRLPFYSALINRMGFNNRGAAALAERLAAPRSLPIPIGVSLGKSRVTPVEQAAEDYCASLKLLYAHGDYFAINISSPNTAGLRSLQDRERLDELLGALQAEARRLAQPHLPKPLLVKLAPDLSAEAISEALDVCHMHGVAGVIACNTTLSRKQVAGDALATEVGGLSGKPLRETALRMVRFISRETGGHLPIIGVGGIDGPDDVQHMLDAGAHLVQIYTGFVYGGPSLVRRINHAFISSS